MHGAALSANSVARAKAHGKAAFVKAPRSVYSFRPMEIITQTSALAALCDRLAEAEAITIDTEFLRDHTYWPKLCLVQLAGPQGGWIIDPLAPGIDLAPLYDLMANRNVLKVFHAARQDLEIFLHQAGHLPTPIFDTQVAAMVCGFGDSVGYEALVAKLTGARVDKSSRFTDWARRPLSDKQLAYALGDVTHLRVVYENLRKQLEKNNRAAWLEEEMAVLTTPDTYLLAPDQAWRRLKTRNTNPRFHAVLRQIAAWRERRAQEKDVPRGRIIRDEVLFEIAAHPPKTRDDLGHIRNLSRGLANGQRGEELLAAVKRGLDIPRDQLPAIAARREKPRGIGPLVELLKVLLKFKSEDSGVAQKLIANVADLEKIAADDNAKVPALTGWRRELFGKDALALKQGRLALAAKGGQVALIEVS